MSKEKERNHPSKLHFNPALDKYRPILKYLKAKGNKFARPENIHPTGNGVRITWDLFAQIKEAFPDFIKHQELDKKIGILRNTP